MEKKKKKKEREKKLGEGRKVSSFLNIITKERKRVRETLQEYDLCGRLQEREALLSLVYIVICARIFIN